MAKKRKKVLLSSFSIILILIFVLGIISHLLPNAKFVGEEIINGSGTVGAKLSQVLMAPILGFEDAIDIAIFIMMLGGLLKVIGKTGALEAGIKALVQKLKGREILLIPILMFIFSICGTTYGMLEETVGFYALLAATMMAAGMDPLVGSAVILLGAGAGCLGSTINPFATGVAISALPDSIKANQGVVILIAVFLWLTTYAICTFFVVRYAKKVKRDKGSTFLSLREQKAAEKKYGSFEEHEENSKKEQEKVVHEPTGSYGMDTITMRQKIMERVMLMEENQLKEMLRFSNELEQKSWLLPHTQEELEIAINRGMEDVKAGRIVSHEDVLKYYMK